MQCKKTKGSKTALKEKWPRIWKKTPTKSCSLPKHFLAHRYLLFSCQLFPFLDVKLLCLPELSVKVYLFYWWNSVRGKWVIWKWVMCLLQFKAETRGMPGARSESEERTQGRKQVLRARSVPGNQSLWKHGRGSACRFYDINRVRNFCRKSPTRML